MKRMLRMAAGAAVLASLALSDSFSAAAESCEGMVAITPATAKSRIAALAFSAGAVRGVHWYNNDGSTSFPGVKVYEALATDWWEPGDCLAALSDVRGISDGWSYLELGTSVVGRSGYYYVVFELPSDYAYRFRGYSGGTAIGYLSKDDEVGGFISGDGATWVALRGSLAVSLVAVSEAGEKGLSRDLGTRAADAGGLRVRPLQNPITNGTSIAYRVPAAGSLGLVLFDIRGRVVRRLVDRVAEEGDHAVYWDGRDDNGQRVPSGTYFARLQTGGSSQSARIVLVR